MKNEKVKAKRFLKRRPTEDKKMIVYEDKTLYPNGWTLSTFDFRPINNLTIVNGHEVIRL
jgi:hypothetical protein